MEDPAQQDTPFVAKVQKASSKAAATEVENPLHLEVPRGNDGQSTDILQSGFSRTINFYYL